MAPDQLAEYRRLLTAGKVAPDRVSEEWEFQRAWNEGIDFAERMLKQALGERPNDKPE